jgi:hypothetical protein
VSAARLSVEARADSLGRARPGRQTYGERVRGGVSGLTPTVVRKGACGEVRAGAVREADLTRTFGGRVGKGTGQKRVSAAWSTRLSA